ncbi:ATP-binding protein [Streptomyces anulatus]
MTTTGARPNATGAPGYSETLPCASESARRARVPTSTAMHTRGLAPLAEDGKLIVSELVSNVIVHTRCHLTRVAITRFGDGTVRIAVADTSPLAPAISISEDDSGSGRGLFLVDALSDRWGYDLHPASKVVWAELRVRADGSGR